MNISSCVFNLIRLTLRRYMSPYSGLYSAGPLTFPFFFTEKHTYVHLFILSPSLPIPYFFNYSQYFTLKQISYTTKSKKTKTSFSFCFPSISFLALICVSFWEGACSRPPALENLAVSFSPEYSEHTPFSFYFLSLTLIP